jgi:hypothetical protein
MQGITTVLKQAVEGITTSIKQPVAAVVAFFTT